jgi:predicted RNase H-related nuclease YkuK (DUF458 family)
MLRHKHNICDVELFVGASSEICSNKRNMLSVVQTSQDRASTYCVEVSLRRRQGLKDIRRKITYSSETSVSSNQQEFLMFSDLENIFLI